MKPSTFPLIALAFVLVPIPVFAGGETSIDSEFNADNVKPQETRDQLTRELSFDHWAFPDQLRRELSFRDWVAEPKPIEPSVMPVHINKAGLEAHIKNVEGVILEVAETFTNCRKKGVLKRAVENARSGRAVGKAFCDLKKINDLDPIDLDPIELLWVRRKLLQLAIQYNRSPIHGVPAKYRKEVLELKLTPATASKSEKFRKHLESWMSDISKEAASIFPIGRIPSFPSSKSSSSKWSSIKGIIKQGRFSVDVIARAAKWLTSLAEFMRNELISLVEELDSQEWAELLMSVHKTLTKLMNDTIHIRSRNMLKYEDDYKALLSISPAEDV